MKKISKEKLKNLFYKIKNKLWAIPITLLLLNQATENIKNAVIKLAMPIRRNFSIC